MIVRKGSCHCASVKFEVETPDEIHVTECNCSICNKSGYLALIVPAKYFKLVEGREHLTEYRFNTGAANHTFCSRCGIKPFYNPRSHPNGISVNVRCLDDQASIKMILSQTDGQNWEQYFPAGKASGYPGYPDQV